MKIFQYANNRMLQQTLIYRSASAATSEPPPELHIE